MRVTVGLAAFAAMVTALAAPVAAQESGIAIKVKQAADVGRAGGQLMLREQAPVFMGDVIKTGPVGEAQIVLSDDTRLVVGPNSLMTIDRFVFASNTTASQVTLNVVQGAFRFITGSSRKDAYTINTPTATIGLRGTEFDGVVNNLGTFLAVLDGEVSSCERFGRNICTQVLDECSVVVTPIGAQLRQIADPAERAEVLTELFPYVVDQHLLDAQFQVDTEDCGDVGRRLTFPPRERADLIPELAPPPPPPPPAPPPPEPEPEPERVKNNNGYGNGGEGDEGPQETNNPGRGGRNQ